MIITPYGHSVSRYFSKTFKSASTALQLQLVQAVVNPAIFTSLSVLIKCDQQLFSLEGKQTLVKIVIRRLNKFSELNYDVQLKSD